jgi:hypothetical protein
MTDNNDINWEEHGLMSDEELKEIDDNFKRTEREGVQNILKYFDRIHDKLFTFNNILIAGYFALSQFFESFSVYGIIIPILNLGLLLIIEYRMMEKSRFESEIAKKSQEEIDKNGLSINKTTRYSLYAIISTTVVVGIFIYNLFSLDSKANTVTNESESIVQDSVANKIEVPNTDFTIIGAWTDYESENATLAFYTDSIFYLDANKMIFYKISSDTLFRHFDKMIDTSKIILLTSDTLIIESNYGTENYGKFKN